jgi:ketosteroid isomerase-like protein
MTSEDPDELNRLWLSAIREKDPARLTKLVEDVNAFPVHSEQARKPQALQ